MRGAVAVVVLLGMAMAGCSPRPGKACKEEGRRACYGKGTMLVCERGTYASYECKGGDGCSKGDTVTCDQSGNAPGDACSKDDTRQYCSADGKAAFVCQGGRLAQVMCAKGCVGGKCREVVPVAGEPCSTTLMRCSADKDHLLGCVDGKWKAVRACRGGQRCDRQASGIVCDSSFVKEGDVCLATTDENFSSCSQDLRSTFTCKGGVWTKALECPAEKGCPAHEFLSHPFVKEDVMVVTVANPGCE